MMFRIALALFALLSMLRTLRQHRELRVTSTWTTLWMVLWTLMIVVAFVPQLTDGVAQMVGVERGADLAVYCAVLLLLVHAYRRMMWEQEMTAHLTAMTRAQAIASATPPQSTNDVPHV